MISLDKAKALRDTGLEWQPEIGDSFAIGWDDTAETYLCSENFSGDAKEDIWLPRLDQLLEDIEKRGYLADSCKNVIAESPGKYFCQITTSGRWKIFFGATREDAATDALLWILKQGKRGA